MLCYRTVVDALPCLSILAVMSWSYYAYVIEFCTYSVEDVSKLTLYLLVYHFLLLMFLWTYFQAMCTNIAIVPEEYKVSRVLYEKIRIADTEEKKNDFLLEFCHKMELDVVTRSENGYIRFCKKCKHVKPDRAHHCSKCGTCILKMDHHCPWLNNCIGFSNYKYFVLFLCYTSLYCIFYAATTLEYFISFWGESFKKYNNLHVVVGFIVSLSFAILGLSFSGYHMSLISKNETTLEVLTETKFRDDNEDLNFNVGTSRNFEEVFGNQWLLWFIPVWSSFGDGVHFPIRLVF